MNCNKCGSPISNGERFCQNCGNSILPSKKKKSAKPILIIIAVLVGLVIFFEILGSDDKPAQGTTTTTTTIMNDEAVKVETTKDTETLSQKNAIKSAKSYLRHMTFSKSGLIHQLEFEEYPHEDAVYAVEHIDVDWNEQAAKSAKSYLSHSSFSRAELIRQLEFEGFTEEEAIYGVTAVGY